MPKSVKNNPSVEYSTFFIKQLRPIQSNSLASAVEDHWLNTLPMCHFYTQILDKTDLHGLVVNQTYIINISQNGKVSIYIGLIHRPFVF